MSQTSAPSHRPLALITGASSGIGFELAKQCADHGYDLLICAEDEGIVAARQTLEQSGAILVHHVQTDLATYPGVEKLMDAVIQLGRPLDVVMANAGVGVGGDFTHTTKLDAELKLIQLNVLSTVHLAKRVLPAMVARGEGRILFTSSIAATMPAPFLAVYGASKAFVQSFAEALRNELKDSGVTITSLMPGPTETHFFDRAGMEDTRVAAEEKDDPAQVARQGFEAMMAGKDQVIAGSWINKIQGVLGKVLPDSAKAEMHRKLTEPGSAHH